MIPAYKIWISVGINDMNNDVYKSKDIIRVSKQISTYIDHFIKCYRIIRVLDENVFKIFILFSGKVKVRQ